jgi:hypothetical protein
VSDKTGWKGDAVVNKWGTRVGARGTLRCALDLTDFLYQVEC